MQSPRVPAVVRTLTTAATLTAFTIGAFVFTAAPEGSDTVSGIPVAPAKTGASLGSGTASSGSDQFGSDSGFPGLSESATAPLYNPFDPAAGPPPATSDPSSDAEPGSASADGDDDDTHRVEVDERRADYVTPFLSPSRDWTQYVTPQPTRTPTPKPDPTSRPTPTPPPTEPTEGAETGTCHGQLVVANYNIKSGTAYGKANLPTIAARLKQWAPDVILLQEVSRNLARGGNIDQAAHLAGQLGYHYAFGANLTFGGNKAYGTAILSRYPIVSSENTALPNRPGGEQRGLLHAVLDVDGREVSAYVTHLQHAPVWEPLRIEQARVVAGILDADPRPKVIGGDFNSHPGSPPMNIITRTVTDTWPAVGQGNGSTVPAPRPNGRIDYLLHEGLAPITARVDPGAASDHLPILATYQVGSC